MQIPESFIFSQHNLQDFSDCRYRFLLRHVQRIDWPAVESEPFQEQEKRIESGNVFHRLVQQYFSGINADWLTQSIEDTQISGWWEEFLKLGIEVDPVRTVAEKAMIIPLQGRRLLAKYDLLLYTSDGRTVIYDWKTTLFRPARKHFMDRMQTKVYPVVLASQTSQSGKVSPEQIEMIYWFPEYPDSQISFEYSSAQFSEDQEYIKEISSMVLAMSENEFEKTSIEKKCAYCQYRTLCDRGITAGEINVGSGFEDPDSDPFQIDFSSL